MKPFCAFYDKLCELRDAFLMKHGRKQLEEDYRTVEERIAQYPKYFGGLHETQTPD